ncbi:MAG: 30S ribosomal protein S9 [Bacteroidetes bacterium]|nr:30S ribosomal protein S9 [Bacteroidota bacterium]
MAYTIATGRRKTSIARIYLEPGSGTILINGRSFEDYFPTSVKRYVVSQPFNTTNTSGQYNVKVNVKGGGISGQSEAIRLGIARALVKIYAEHKPPMKALGLMTRDPRMVERKKFGKKKARKSFQFSKR